ncbi:hypothetical protein [Neisseria musculi]|uniref:Uncharacterized protein n=1 Tax=Neisseria musculi TaxID=1815583 RepID=A0A7H1M9Y5_9NEIS|nr:hypothetical protein [Neisseria musculi]QNT58450.1 hypothetical protein H7A79_1008 [Neisseria musculi]
MEQFVYDINDAKSFDYVQNVRVRIQMWEYSKEYSTSVGGNVPGFGIFECAIGNIVDEIIRDEVIVSLHNAAGERLLVDLNEEGKPEEAFMQMVVAVEITGIERKHAKE